jgi:hypothetical protein
VRIFPAEVKRNCPHGPVCNRASRYQGLLALLWLTLFLKDLFMNWPHRVGWMCFETFAFVVTFDAFMAHTRPGAPPSEEPRS